MKAGISEEFVKLIGITNNVDDATSVELKKYFLSTFSIDKLLDKVWYLAKDFPELSRNAFRLIIVSIALGKKPKIIDDRVLHRFSQLTSNEATAYLFYAMFPQIKNAYKSYITNNKYIYDKIEKQNIDFYDFLDETFIIFKSEILKEDNFNKITDNKNADIINTLKSMFTARLADLAQELKRKEATHGLADHGPIDSDDKKTINMTEPELDKMSYSYDGEEKDYSEFLKKWTNCCNDTKYKFNRWSFVKRSSDGTEKPNRKAKILKFLVINALESLGTKSAKDIYTSLYIDISNPKQKWDGEISGTLSNANKELTLKGILDDYNITITELVDACRDLGVDVVLGKLKGMGSKLPQSDLQKQVTAAGLQLANGRDILNENK